MYEQMHEDLKETEDVSLLEDAGQLESRHAAVTKRLAELENESKQFQDALDAAIAQSEKATTKMEDLSALAEKLLAKIESTDLQEAKDLVALEKAEDRSAKAEALLGILEKKITASQEELDKADEDMGAAASAAAAQTASQLQLQTKLIQLVQETQHLRHEESRMAHEEAVKKVGESEALLEEHTGRLQGDHGEECDDLRAKVIHAKAELAKASSALKSCLQAKVDIQAKIDKVEELRDAATKSLDQCLQTKARLKAALDECHTRRDSAREKLQECLNRKKDLKVKINECHKKRDAARAKLAECLKHKKVLGEKIAKAKASLGSSSLMEVDGSAVESDAEADLEEALQTLQGINDDFDDSAQEYISISNLIQHALSEIGNSSAEEQAVKKQLEDALALETSSQVLAAQLQSKLQSAYEDLKAIDRQSDAAAKASEAAGKIADQVTKGLSSLLSKL
jgi:chromosome segregation ATPase